MSVISSIDQREFLRAITRGGFTLCSFKRQKGIDVSRERMRQIAEIFGVKGVISARKPCWYAVRYKKPALRSKAKIEALLKEKGSLGKAAISLGVDTTTLAAVCRAHKIASR